MTDELGVDGFLNLLQQSDLLPDAKISALREEFGANGAGPRTAQELSEVLVNREVLTPWQAENLLKGKHRGFRLGPYRILQQLGQGGMSKVFLAEHEMMHRRCAVKVLPSKYQEDADLLNRFHLEAIAVAALDHPNIVRAYDFNKDVRYGKPIHYLVMEYVEGPDLRRMVEEQGPLDYRKAADFVCQAAEGLAHAHAAGFVHRDIKPANLLVDPHGVLKVLDLGLAATTLEAETLHAPEGTPSAVGTADYVAPEQVLDSRSVDGRADIYSLGHTFYYLLTGRRPFSKPTIMELLMAHRNEKPEPISRSRPDVPLDLEAIIDKMTAKQPLHRYQSAKEVAEKLRAWVNDSGSGREYSRISALMAEALRAKQAAGDEPNGEKAPPSKNADLELASLDDEPKAAPGVKTAASASRPEPKTPAQSQSRTPIETGKPGSTASQTDLLSGLFSEAFGPPALPAGQQDLVAGQPVLAPMAKATEKKHLGIRDLLISPWPWVGLVGVVLLSFAVFLLVVFAPSSPREIGTRPSPVAPVQPIQRPPAPVPSATQDQPPQALPPTPVPPAPTADGNAPAPTTDGNPPAPTTDGTATPQPDDGIPPDIPPAGVEPIPPEAVTPKPLKKLTADEKSALAAGVTKLAIRIESLDPTAATEIKARAEPIIIRKLKLEEDPDAATVLLIELKAKPAAGVEPARTVLSADLRCADADGTSYSVWTRQKILNFDFEIAPKTRAINQISDRARDLFDQFERFIEGARKKAAGTQPSHESAREGKDKKGNRDAKNGELPKDTPAAKTAPTDADKGNE